MRHVLLAVAALLVGGCYTTRVDVRPAAAPTQRPNSIIIEKSRAEVWAKGIPALASKFFAINIIDQASGLVSVSYSGDPQQYVVGPVFTYIIQRGGGETEGGAAPPEYSRVTFPGTQPSAQYMVAEGERAAVVTRRMALEGRANIVLEEIGPTRTRVTANVRYVLTQTRALEPVGRWIPAPPEVVTVGFDTSGRGAFAAREDAFYYPTGDLEADILSAFQ